MASDIEAIVAKLRSTVGSLAAISRRRDPERRQELIALRRDLMSAMSALGDAIRSDPRIAAGGWGQAFVEQLSQVRARVDYHQATWSVVLIDGDPTAYRASADATSAALVGLLDAVTEALARRPTT